MSEYELSLTKREVTGKKVKNLREKGLIPSVIFGGEKKPVLAQSAYNETEKVLLEAGYHSPIDLTVEGKRQMALVKTVDLDPVKRTIRNVEFQAISANEIVEATAPITIINFEQSEANKNHLTLLQVMEEIDVKAKPADLPDEIEVDAAGMKTVDDRLTIADIKLPAGVVLADKELDPEQAVANVYDPAAEAAEREAEAEADKAAEAARAAEAEAAATTPTAAPAADDTKDEAAK